MTLYDIPEIENNNEIKSNHLKDNFNMKKKDLVSRERVNFVVDSSIMKYIRFFSKKNQIPMSRMIDKALKDTYLKEDYILTTKTDKLYQEITMSHLIAITIFSAFTSQLVVEVINLILTITNHYIYSDCFIIDEKQNRKLGTKINLYLNDDDEEKFSIMLLKLSDYKEKVRVTVDGEQIEPQEYPFEQAEG